MYLPAKINFDKTVLPKKIKLLTLIIVVPIVLYLVAISIILFLNWFHNGIPFQIKPLTFTQTSSEKDKLHNFVWEYPLKTLIAVPYNVHFHLEFKSNKCLTDDILKPVVLTASDSYSGAVLYEERIYPHGDELVVRDYHWCINQNWKGSYIRLFSLDEKNLLKIESAILGWNISLNPSLISIIFNEALLNSKWLLIYLIFNVIILRLIFFCYYPALAYKKVKFDFSNPIPWIICVLAVAFQFYLMAISAYPLYEHDYEMLLSAIKRIQTGYSDNFVRAGGYFFVPPFPDYCTSYFVRLIGVKWGYFLFVILRIILVWSVLRITRWIYRDNTSAYTALLFACLLPFNLHFSPLMHVSGYDKNYYLDLGKIMATTLLYAGIAIGFGMLNERNIARFRILVLMFCICGITAILSRTEMLLSYGFIGVAMIGLCWFWRGKQFLRIYLLIAGICGVVGILILYMLFKGSGKETARMYHHSLHETLKIFYLYFTTDHVYNTWITIACPLFFRLIMVRFSLKIVLLEAVLLCCFISAIFALYYHTLMYCRFMYVIPIQAIIAGIGITSLFQFLVQTWILVKESMSLRSISCVSV